MIISKNEIKYQTRKCWLNILNVFSVFFMQNETQCFYSGIYIYIPAGCKIN